MRWSEGKYVGAGSTRGTRKIVGIWNVQDWQAYDLKNTRSFQFERLQTSRVLGPHVRPGSSTCCASPAAASFGFWNKKPESFSKAMINKPFSSVFSCDFSRCFQVQVKHMQTWWNMLNAWPGPTASRIFIAPLCWNFPTTNETKTMRLRNSGNQHRSLASWNQKKHISALLDIRDVLFIYAWNCDTLLLTYSWVIPYHIFYGCCRIHQFIWTIFGQHWAQHSVAAERHMMIRNKLMERCWHV